MTLWFVVAYMGVILVQNTYIGDLESCKRDAAAFNTKVEKESSVNVRARCEWRK